MSGKPGKRAHARARLVDDVERGCTPSKPLVKALKAVGVDPASPEAKQLVSYNDGRAVSRHPAGEEGSTAADRPEA
jgi:hypothetical protein